MKKDEKKQDESTNPLENDLTQALEKISELEEKLLRTMADLQNVRRRALEERANLLKTGGIEIVEKLLPALDYFDRAMHLVPKEIAKNDWVKGISAIEKSLFDTLKQEGLEIINQVNVNFDPTLHEAIQIDEKGKKGVVMEIFEKGFRINGKVLRVAKVKVGSK